MEVNAVQHVPTPGSPNAPDAQRAPDAELFEAVYQRAENALSKVADQFVATTLVYPLLEQADNSPFKTELFDGGFTESAFRQRLNMRIADDIATSPSFSFGKTLTGRFTEWVRQQSPQRLQNADWYKGVNTIG